MTDLMMPIISHYSSHPQCNVFPCSFGHFNCHFDDIMMSAAEMFLELVVHVMVGVMIITVEAGAFFCFYTLH